MRKQELLEAGWKYWRGSSRRSANQTNTIAGPSLIPGKRSSSTSASNLQSDDQLGRRRPSSQTQLKRQYSRTMSDHIDSLLSQKSSDSGLHLQLHPLVLLTISDHITRHAARSQQGPIIGALLGQQNGREITVEHAFECVVVEGPNGEAQLPNDWFVDRVKQCKDLHSDYHEPT